MSRTVQGRPERYDIAQVFECVVFSGGSMREPESMSPENGGGWVVVWKTALGAGGGAVQRTESEKIWISQ